MNGQYLGGRPITLSYAFKKDGQKGERHGSTAERRLADMGKKNNYIVTGLPMNAIPALPPPLPQGFMQAANAPPGAAPPGAPPVGPTPVPGQYLAPTPAGPPPGFSGAAIPGQAPPGFGPPPGMPPPPTGF
jgi:splicing factor 3B subunit 4